VTTSRGETRHASVEITGEVAVLTLTNPGKRNAIGLQMAREIVEACATIDDGDCGAVVVRGAGGYFCSGADRSLLRTVATTPSERDGMVLLDEVYQSFTRIGALQVPVIAAVRGGAVGAGLNLALAADIRIVAEDAVLSSGFRQLGIHQGGGHGHLVTTLAGPEVAAAMIVFGESITGQRAREIGLAWQAVPDDQVEARALELAAIAASDAPLSRRMIASIRSSRARAWRARVAEEGRGQIWSLRRTADR
jgi:enoyl-CoA hydratase